MVNSIVLVEVSSGDNQAEVIARVDRLEGEGLYCSKAIVSKNGGPWQYAKEVMPGYEGELLKNFVRNVNTKEFETFHDFYPNL